MHVTSWATRVAGTASFDSRALAAQPWGLGSRVQGYKRQAPEAFSMHGCQAGISRRHETVIIFLRVEGIERA